MEKISGKSVLKGVLTAGLVLGVTGLAGKAAGDGALAFLKTMSEDALSQNKKPGELAKA